MSATLGRAARPEEPEVTTDRIVLEPPPAIAPHEGAGGVAMTVIPMLGSLGSIVLVASMAGAGGAGAARSYLAAGMFLLATVGFVVVQIDRQRTLRARQVTGSRTAYLRYLDDVRRVVRRAADQQRRVLTRRHPDPATLPALAAERSRVWERGPSDEGFLHVRYGTRAQPLATELVPPENVPTDEADPAAASALHRLLAVHGLQPDLPASIDLGGLDRIEVRGAPAPTRALARALVCSAAAFHSPGHLVVAVLSSAAHLVHWDWLKWLPHALSTRESDAVGPRRLVTTSLEELAALLPADLGERPRFGASEGSATPHVLLLTDGITVPPGHDVVPSGGRHGVTVLDLSPHEDEVAEPGRLRLELTDAEPGRAGARPLRAMRVREEPIAADGDQCDLMTAEAFARRLAPLHTARAGPGSAGAGPDDVVDLLGLGDVRRFDLRDAWRPRPPRDRLRVPIGVGEGGEPVHLDLKESAQQGMGPHGLVVGATGSGKSELLRTLVLGLALSHSPQQLNLVLVDFKGGATFAGMSGLPHVSAVITNLAQELTLVDRMQDALSGEMVRRQEQLRAAGNVASVRDYEEARRTREGLAPLPSLFVVVDEFSELLSAKPEFIDLFVAIGRLGRSLGLHLLLASQRLEEGRLRGLESHLSYRIGLRTFSAGDSRAVLGVPDAHELPPVPGLGYLRPDPTRLLPFRAGYVSGPPPGPTRSGHGDTDRTPGILPFTITRVPDPARTEPAPPEPDPTPVQPGHASLLDLAVGRMLGQGTPAHRVWLPPLDVPDTLDRLLPDLEVDDRLGLASREWRARGGLVVPLGTIDRPREQRRDTLSVDLRGSSGHVAVVGGPRSGKSTLLRTVVAGLALTTTPLESQFYVLDLGGTLATLARLPHVAGVASRTEPDVVRRILAEVRGIVDRREDYFRHQGIDSIETYRARRAAGRADDGYGDVFLVVDGWATLRAELDEIEGAVQELSTRGLTFGLHVITAAGRWADFRAAMRDVFGTRLELRLGDPMDSEVDRKLARLVPTGRPGRGLVPSGLHFLAALPRVDGDPDPGTTGEGVDDLVERVAAAWPGQGGPKLRLLPERVELATVRGQADHDGSEGRRLLLGVDEQDLAPVALDVDREPHLLLLGDARSGKSAALRCYLHEVMRTRTPEQAQLVLVDYRRSHLGEVPDRYLLDHLTSAHRATVVLRDLADHLAGRIPGEQVTPEQLRNRSWWTGAEVFVVVDDYDLVTTRGDGPVAALQPLLARARDIGLHVVVARRSGGASRAMYEPVLQSLRDLASTGLLLAGDPDEGPLIGALTPRPAVPGRGRLVTRDRGVETLQVCWVDPTL